MSSENTVYVVTGGNRGIGLGLVKALLARPNTTVISTVRSKETATSHAAVIVESPKGANSEHYTAEIDYSTDLDSAIVSKKFAAATAGKVNHVDVLICNAGYFTTMATVLDTTPEELRSHFDVNTLGPLVTIQALWPLMKSGPEPKFFLISSSVGSIGMMEAMPGGAYGPSKAAANWLAKALHQQIEKLVSVAVHPGFVQTNMGNSASAQWGMDNGPPDSVDESVAGLLNLFDSATKESASGKFITQKGMELLW
ncbi:hypothetical protein VHEMI04184 [[Torrubiella] hemipterigena]|uniref:Uncharacterized protein n=1 Tax=[Torrubiella] hemipterigena TaxID=1531966 RepID=A0A0A1TFP9_9HYPO|nr:hypothetical protein VHEMI04184 [[Torrubiella] hemipterigena]